MSFVFLCYMSPFPRLIFYKWHARQPKQHPSDHASMSFVRCVSCHLFAGLSSISGMHGSPSSTDISRSSSAEADGPVEGTLNRDEYQEGGMLNRGEYQETVAGSSEMRGGQQGAKGHGVEDRWKKEGDAGLLGATRMSSSSFHTRTTRIGTPT